MGTEGGDKCVDNVDKLRKKWWGGEKGTNPEEVCNTTGRQRGQGNFELAANFGYSSRGSADPRESLRRRRISKLALNAHKVLPQTVQSAFGLGIGCFLKNPTCITYFQI